MIIKNGKTISSVIKGSQVIDKIMKGTLVVYESFKNLLASGVPPLTLTKCKGVDLIDYKIYGESVQDGTPTPETPIEIESVGEKTKNLLPINDYEGVVFWSDITHPTYAKVEVIPNTKYTFSAEYFEKLDNIDGGSIVLYIYGNSDLSEESRILATGISAAGNVGFDKTPFDYTFDIGDYTEIYCVLRNNRGINTNIKINGMMLRKADTNKDYEPYGYKTPITVRGKNLYDAEGHFNAICKSETLVEYQPIKGVVDGVECYQYYGRNFSKQTQETSKVPNNFKENTQYTISFDAYDIFYTNPSNGVTLVGINISFVYTDGTIKSLSNFNGIGKEEKIWKHWSASSEANKTLDYIQWIYGTGPAQTFFANFQIEEGAIETKYEPYIEPTTTNIYLNEPLRKIGGYADYIDFENSKVVRNICNEYLTTVTTKSTASGTYSIFLTDISQKPIITKIAGQVYGCAMSNKFKQTEYGYTDLLNYPNNIIPYITTGGINRVAYSFNDTSITTIPLAQEKIGDGFEVNYILATPTEETIELPNIPTIKGTTILEVDTTIQPSNLEVVYKGKEVK